MGNVKVIRYMSHTIIVSSKTLWYSLEKVKAPFAPRNKSCNLMRLQYYLVIAEVDGESIDYEVSIRSAKPESILQK
jgi:hypothetical protein